MKKDWLSFLYGESQLIQELESDGIPADDLEKLFEDADKDEADNLKVSKKSLAAALESAGIRSTDGLQVNAEGCYITCDNGDCYRIALNKLADPDVAHKLAEAGWVAEKCGDIAMHNEPEDYRVKFLDITTVETSDEEFEHSEDTTKPDMEKVIKDARKFATTPMDRSDKLNPVENPAVKDSGSQPGIGKATDGSQPEGKIKESRLHEMTTAGCIPAVEMGVTGAGLATKGPGKRKLGGKFKTPRQWRQRFPITKH